MATVKKSKTTKKMKKQHQPDYYPVQRQIAVGVDNGLIAGTCVGDMAKLLSISNRRLYRYGNLYQIKVDLDMEITNNSNVQVEVYALRNTWDVQRSFALAKKVWEESSKEERESAGSLIARWRDFRVEHGITGASILDPMEYDSATLAATVANDGEHSNSIVDKNGVETFFTWGNSDANSISIMSEWNQAGRTSTDPSTSSDLAPYDGVNSDEMSNIELEALSRGGNSPPYGNQSPTDCWIKVATLYYRPGVTPSAGGLAKLSSGYFDAPCGLFALKVNVGGDRPNGDISVTAKAGDYKGVMAQSMTQR